MSLNKIIKFPTIDSKKNIFFLAIIYYAIFFLPMILYAYFYCDDKILIYSIPVETQIYNNNLFQISYQLFKDFLASGRFYGLYATHNIIFYFFHDRISYYVVKYLFNLIAVASFAWLLKLLTKDTANGRAFIFLMPSINISRILTFKSIIGLSLSITQLSPPCATLFQVLFFLDSGGGKCSSRKRSRLLCQSARSGACAGP